MSIIIKYFAAPHDAAAAQILNTGPAGVFDTLDYGNFDAMAAMIEWESIVTGRSFEELVADDVPRMVAGTGPFVFAASPRLQTALAAADHSAVAELATRWIEQDDQPLDHDVSTETLSALAALARTADPQQHTVYCWMC